MPIAEEEENGEESEEEDEVEVDEVTEQQGHEIDYTAPTSSAEVRAWCCQGTVT